MIRLKFREAAIAALLLCSGALLRADVIPAPLFTNNAVLQRDKPIPVWGTADPGEKISVTFAGHTVATMADATGRWHAILPAQPATATPSDLVITGNNTLRLTNILVGEVWIASGQSNMEFIVSNSYDAAIDIPASAQFPLIRHFKIARKISETPSATSSGTWQVAGPKTTGSFTAVGYYFALDLCTVLGVPVGIINSTWGGTFIEPWMDTDTLNAPAFADLRKSWQESISTYDAALAKSNADHAVWLSQKTAAETNGQAFTAIEPKPPSAWGRGAGGNDIPSGLYNGMINPLVPYALRGAIWYQGENNTGYHSDYHALFSAMITGWRAQFNQGDFPFYWVQLANYASPTDTNWAFLREAQTQTLSLPHTCQAVTIDIGNVRDIHPRNKKDVGRRLARLALKRDYGINVADSGPVFVKAEREGAGYRVSFTEINGGLIATQNELGGFELAGVDKVFHPADAKIAGDTVLVTSADVSDPVAVRYAWHNGPLAGLFNKEGLPAVPFRSDTW
jgi:sialate O-acetylesterase